MNLRDQLSGLFWLVISIFVCVESLGMGTGTFRSPGPGLFPFCSAVALGTFAIVLVGESILKKNEGRRISDPWKGMEWSKVILVLISLSIHAVLLSRIGYLVTTFGLMVFLLSLAGGTSLWIQAGSALIIALLTYIIFYVWLGVQLPKGIFGF